MDTLKKCSACGGSGNRMSGMHCLDCSRCGGCGFEPVQPKAAKQEKVKSNGSSSAYYQLPPGATELRHLIQAKDMDFAVGNIFKACYRLGEKEGTEEIYDVRKIIFFGFDELEKVSKKDYAKELAHFRDFIDSELARLNSFHMPM